MVIFIVCRLSARFSRPSPRFFSDYSVFLPAAQNPDSGKGEELNWRWVNTDHGRAIRLFNLQTGCMFVTKV